MAEFRMDVERDEGEPLGAQVDEQLRVIKIVPSSLADGHLLAGDTILTVNEKKVKTKEHLFQLLRFAHPRLRLLVRRPQQSNQSTMSAGSSKQMTMTSGLSSSTAQETAGLGSPGLGNKGVSPEMEKFVRRRTGFEYLTAEVDWESNKQRALGITLTTRLNRVIVTNLKPGSLGEEKLRLLDRILGVNNIPVSDKDVAKAMIIQSGGKFSVTIERPITDEARKEFQDPNKKTQSDSDQHLKPTSVPTAQPVPSSPSQSDPFGLGKGDPSILPPDVLEITKAAIIKRREGKLVAGKSVLKHSTDSRQAARLIIRNQSRECFITSDLNTNAQISHVPKADPENILPKEEEK